MASAEDENPLSDPEERRVLFAALDSFQSYRRVAHFNTTHVRRQAFYSLPSEHWSLLAKPPFNILQSLSDVDDAIDVNAALAEAIAETGRATFVGTSPDDQSSSEADNDRPWKGTATPSDMDKARSTIRQLWRDWSAEGQCERDACYNPVLAALDDEFKNLSKSARAKVNVLVPGVGLGRLLCEICTRGYTVEGNEISYHQLMASNFILNHTSRAEEFGLHPWALSFSNHRSRSDQLQQVRIPDIHPGTTLNESSSPDGVHAFERMSMCAADFCVAYKKPENKERFDAVTTVFFIDTAPNLIRYIEAISHCLKLDGLWINLGPLLWHFENKANNSSSSGTSGRENNGTSSAEEEGIGEAGSVELTNEEVLALLEHFGFNTEHAEYCRSIEQRTVTGYIQNPKSMLQNTYLPSFWIARKGH